MGDLPKITWAICRSVCGRSAEDSMVTLLLYG